MNRVFRAGIVGLRKEGGWGAIAHLPALGDLSDMVEMVGVANTSLESAKSAAIAHSIPHAFSSVAELVQSSEIDIIVVAVKVEHHRDIVVAALESAKNIYCEWPLGRDLEQGIQLSQLAGRTRAKAVVGLQALASPELAFLRDIVADGYIGEVLSSTYFGNGVTWGNDVSQADAYAMDSRSGATMLSIIAGHAVSAVQMVLGRISEISAVLTRRKSSVRVIETGEIISMRTHDHVMVNALLQSGVPLSLQLRGGLPRGVPLLWEINGTRGDLRVTAVKEELPAIQIARLRIDVGRDDQKGFHELNIPESYYPASPEASLWRNVSGVYRLMFDDLRFGTQKAPSFAAGLIVHAVVDAIERSHQAGRRVRVF